MGLWVHSAMYAKIQNDYLSYKETVLFLIEQFGINRIVFSGHSLGGGLARIAHMAAYSAQEQMPPERSERLKLSEVEMLSITFASPMVFFPIEKNRRLYGEKMVTRGEFIQRMKLVKGKSASMDE